MTLSEVKSVKNISKNPQSFLEISPMQKEVLLSHKLQDDVYELKNPFGLPYIQQKCQESLIQGKIHTFNKIQKKASNIHKAKF